MATNENCSTVSKAFCNEMFLTVDEMTSKNCNYKVYCLLPKQSWKTPRFAVSMRKDDTELQKIKITNEY